MHHCGVTAIRTVVYVQLLRLAIEIPSAFQRDLERNRQLDRNLILMLQSRFGPRTARGHVERSTIISRSYAPPRFHRSRNPVRFEARALFNQAFKSIYALVPGDIMFLLILIPSMLTALSVVREKELGLIANFYVAPAHPPRIFFSANNCLLRGLRADSALYSGRTQIFHIQVPFKGSLATLVLGGMIHVLASTGLGCDFGVC